MYKSTGKATVTKTQKFQSRKTNVSKGLSGNAGAKGKITSKIGVKTAAPKK